MQLTGLCGQRFRLTLELDQGYSRPPGEEPNRPVLIEPIMPTEQRGQPSEIRVLFDPFELNVTERSLKKADHVIPLGGRAFDILLALVDRAGEVIGKDELMRKHGRTSRSRKVACVFICRRCARRWGTAGSVADISRM